MAEPPFFRHAWLMFVAVTVANALILKFRSRGYIRERPELAAGYTRLFRGVLFWGNLPWLVMGIGIELGGVPGIFSYFRPRDGNPYVLAWFAAVLPFGFSASVGFSFSAALSFWSSIPAYSEVTHKARRLFDSFTASCYSAALPELPSCSWPTFLTFLNDA